MIIGDPGPLEQNLRLCQTFPADGSPLWWLFAPSPVFLLATAPGLFQSRKEAVGASWMGSESIGAQAYERISSNH